MTGLIDGLKTKMDDDDLLVVYVTGHGDNKEEGECAVVGDTNCLPIKKLEEEFKDIRYGRRIVVMDQCQSGGALPLFADDKTTIVTAGSSGANTCCDLFSPFFWSREVTDIDKNGIVTIDERYIYAVTTGKPYSLTQYYEPDNPVSFSGTADNVLPFGTDDGKDAVTTVNNLEELEKQLKRLKPGQLALVQFSADWCAPCHVYSPKFDELAKKYKGRFLMIRAEGMNGSENDWGKYGGTSFPTVAFVDARGRAAIVGEPGKIGDPMEYLLPASVNSVDNQLRLYKDRIESSDSEKRRSGIMGIGSLGERAVSMLPVLIKLLSEKDAEIRRLAVKAISMLGRNADIAVPKLANLLEDPEFKVRKEAVDSLGEIAAAGGDISSAVPSLIELFKKNQFEELGKEFFNREEPNRAASSHFAYRSAEKGAFELCQAICGTFIIIGKTNTSAVEKFLAVLGDTDTPPYNVTGAVSYLALVRTFGETFKNQMKMWVPTLAKLSGSEYGHIRSFAKSSLEKIVKEWPEAASELATLVLEKNTPLRIRFNILCFWKPPGPIIEAAKKIVMDENEDMRIRAQAAWMLKRVKAEISNDIMWNVEYLIRRKLTGADSLASEKKEIPKYESWLPPEPEARNTWRLELGAEIAGDILSSNFREDAGAAAAHRFGPLELARLSISAGVINETEMGQKAFVGASATAVSMHNVFDPFDLYLMFARGGLNYVFGNNPWFRFISPFGIGTRANFSEHASMDLELDYRLDFLGGKTRHGLDLSARLLYQF